MKVADIAPGSYALLQPPEGGAISGVFRLPSGRGWLSSPSEGERFPKTEHLDAPDAHKRGGGWEWGPLEKYTVDLVAAGLTAEDFASAEALAGALRAKARPSRKVGDEVDRGDLPSRCVARSVNPAWGVAHVKGDRSYRWIADVDGTARDKPGASDSIDEAPPPKWRILALDVPDDASAQRAREIAGIAEAPKVKVGDIIAANAKLPSSCCAIALSCGEIARVAADRSYHWIHKAEVRAGTSRTIDALSDTRWEVLALDVPEDATHAEARALAGRSLIGDTIRSQYQAPGSICEQTDRPAGDRALYCIRRQSGEGWKVGRDRAQEFRRELHGGNATWWNWRDRVRDLPMRVLAVEFSDADLRSPERFEALLGLRKIAVGDEVEGDDQPHGSLAMRLGDVHERERYRVRRADGCAWNVGADPSNEYRRQLASGDAGWWPYTHRPGRVRILALDVPDADWRDSAKVDAWIKDSAPGASPASAPAALPKWAGSRGALVVLGDGSTLLWYGGGKWARLRADADPAPTSEPLPPEARDAVVALDALEDHERERIAALRPSTELAASRVAAMLLRLRSGDERWPNGWGIYTSTRETSGAPGGGIFGGRAFDWIHHGTYHDHAALFRVGDALRWKAGHWWAEDRDRNVVAEGMTEAQAKALAFAIHEAAPGDACRARQYDLLTQAARWWLHATPDERRSPPLERAWAAERRPAPAWATGSGGALLALPDKRIALWWGADDGGRRWAIVDCPSDREVEPLRPREPSPWADGPTSSAGPLDGARVVAGDLPAETVRALALLRPATEEAAQRAADMLSRARGGRPRGCALLIGRDAIGVMWADGAYGFAQAKPAEFTIAEWKVGRDFVDVAIDDLTEAQAVALWRKVGDSRADALEAARLRLRLGASMDRSPPRGHEWVQARGHVRVELCRSPLGTMEVFGGADAPAGTLLYRATPGKGDQGDVWLRSAAGWALVSVMEDGNGWPGDERRAPRDSRREMQVLARDLSPEAQAGLLLRARRARDEGARLSGFTLDKLCEALDAAVAAASARGTALAQLRGRLLADLGAEPWRAGWRSRTLPDGEAEQAGARVASGFGGGSAGWRLGLTLRYLRHYTGWASWLGFADWRGWIMPAKIETGSGEDLCVDLLRRAVEEALAQTARAADLRSEAQARALQRPTSRAREHLQGAPGCPLPEAKASVVERSRVDTELWADLCSAISRALGEDADKRAGVYPYRMKPGTEIEALQHGGLALPDPRRPTVLAVVGARSEEDLGRAVRAVLPGLERAARASGARAGLVALGPETRARLL